MKVQDSLKIAHMGSVGLSVLVNGLLLLLLMTFLVGETTGGVPDNVIVVIEPEAPAKVDPPLPDLPTEPVTEPDEKQILDIPNMKPVDVPVFDPDPKPVDNTAQKQPEPLSTLLTDAVSIVKLPGLGSLRDEVGRQKALTEYGGEVALVSEPAVRKALGWLRDHQAPNGSWNKAGTAENAGGNAGYTGLALLTFLAHGDTSASKEYGLTVANGLRFLVANQVEHGVFQPAGSHTAYGHAMATYAMAEAYSMTRNPLLRDPLERAVRVMIEGQMPNGGYNYDYKLEDNHDLSLGAWHVQALKAAAVALPENGEVKKALQTAMDGMLLGSKLDGGARGFTYKVQTGLAPGAFRHIISSAGALGLHLSGRSSSRECGEAMKFLRQYLESDQLPNWGQNPDFEYGGQIMHWYYTVQAFFHEDPKGKHFQRYMPAMVNALVQHQAEDGHWLCYSNGKSQGPVFHTTLGAMGLMVFYRHLPGSLTENTPVPAPAAPPVDEAADEVKFDLT